MTYAEKWDFILKALSATERSIKTNRSVKSLLSVGVGMCRKDVSVLLSG